MKHTYRTYIVLVLLVIGITGSVEASVVSDAFIKLVNIQSRSSKITMHSEFNLDTRSKVKQYIDFNATSRGDNAIPGATKLDTSLGFKTNMLAILGAPQLNITINMRLVGDTLYFQIPDAPFDEFVPTLVPYKNQWIRFNKEDLNAIIKSLPSDEITAEQIKEANDAYDKVMEANNQPQKEMVKITDTIKKYDKAFLLKKSNSRNVGGITQDKYLITINKKTLLKILVADIPEKDTTTMTSSIRISLIHDIIDTLSHIVLKNTVIYIDHKDNLPYEISSTIQTLGNKNKVETTTKFKMYFSEFGSHFDDIVTPPQFTTGALFFNNVIKRTLDDARVKGQNAALRSMLGNFRVQAEIVYGANNNSYGSVANNGNCTSAVAGSVFNPASENINTVNLVKSITRNASSTSCYSTPSAWAFAVKNKDNSISYCADSTGAQREINSTLTGTTCPNN